MTFFFRCGAFAWVVVWTYCWNNRICSEVHQTHWGEIWRQFYKMLMKLRHTINWTSSNILRLKGFRSSFGNIPNLNISSFGREKYDMRLSKWPCSSWKLLTTNEMQNNRFVLKSDKIIFGIFVGIDYYDFRISHRNQNLVYIGYIYHNSLIPDGKTITSDWH